MKKLFLLVVLLNCIFFLSADLIVAYSNSNVIITGSAEIIPIKDIDFAGNEYVQIKSLEEATIGLPGQAELPGFSKLVKLPDTGNYVLNKMLYDFDEIQLEKHIIPIGWEDKLARDEDYYSKEGWFPVEPVTISKPNIMRGVRFSQIAISKVQYNPALKRIRILKNIEADLQLDESINLNPLAANRISKTTPFSTISQELIIGFEHSKSNQNGSYLMICPDHIVAQLQNLKRHKERLGYFTKIAPLSETGSTNNEIKNYLQNAYDTWENPPEYVILVGDVSGTIVVPTFFVESQGDVTDTAASDHVYTLLEGDDFLPDIMLGRISVQTTLQLATVINKIISYESNPFMGEWMSKSLMITEIFLYGDNNYTSARETKMQIREKLLEYTHAVVDTFFYPYQSGMLQLQNVIDSGYSLINFRGHGSATSWTGHWGYSFFHIDNVQNLHNGYMLPFVTSMTCGTGDFASQHHQTNFGETWLAAGTPANPKGAIGFIGPTEYDTNTGWNNANDMGIYHGITHEQLYRGGEMLLRGKMALYINYPNHHGWGGPLDSAQFYFFVYNLLGDPGLAVWTDTPEEITLEVKDEMMIGENYLQAKVITEDTDNSDFKIAITNSDGLIATGTTDENGEVFISVELAEGNYQITASKYGFIPETQDINVVVGDMISLGSYSFSGELISGNTVTLNGSIINLGGHSVAGIEVDLISDDSFLDVLTETVFIDELAAMDSVSADFQFQIGREWKNGIQKELFLHISSDFGESNFLIPVVIKSPDLVLAEFMTEHQDNYLLQNSLQNVNIKLYNSSAASGNFSVHLSSLNDKAEVIQPHSTYDNIEEFATQSNNSPFQIYTGSAISGELARFKVTILENEYMVSESIISIPIGYVNKKSPTFSEYGYYAIECRDVGNFESPEYDWIEIDPKYGGNGSLLQAHTGHSDGYIGTVILPFTFQYFIKTYDTISICSNGYITMGESDLIFFRNRHLPSGVGARALIAPFWDNLADGNIYTYYDREKNYFVIQWSEFKNEFNPIYEETFQVILYDPEYYPTPTNDGKFKFQYKEVHNIDTEKNYATVGISNHTQDDGILITFADIYPKTAHSLQNETAILFTIKEIHSLPFLKVEQSSIQLTLPNNTETTQLLTLQNSSVSNENLSYTIELGNFRQGMGSVNRKKRSIENDWILLSTPFYYTSMALNIQFYLIHNSPDGEAVYGVKMDFPEGFYIERAEDIGTLKWNGETGDGAEVTWGYGNGDVHTATTPERIIVTAIIDESISQPADIHWFIQGDGTGEEPHEVDGVVTILPSENSFIWITYPEPEQVMVYGMQDSVKWASYGGIDEVNIFWDNEYSSEWEMIAANIENTGLYEFIVPGPLSESNRIRVRSLDGNTSDSSPHFRITAFNVDYPKHNTIMTYGTQDSLTWIDTGGLESVDIYISRNNGKNWDLFAEQVENSGFYAFEVPGPPSDRYIFKISSHDDIIYNVSSMFAITDAPIDWFSLDSYQGVIGNNDTHYINVNFNSKQLAQGTYSAYINIKTALGQTISIPVELDVVDEYYDNFQLYGNYPNPFSLSTNLSFSLPQNIHDAKITIFNVKGQKVRTLLYNTTSFQATHSIMWDGRDNNNRKVGTGIYFYNIKAGNRDLGTSKCILIK